MPGPWLRLDRSGVEYKHGRRWDKMSGGDSWRIITALRGPDDNNLELKETYTAKVRGLFCAWDDNGIVTWQPEWILVSIVEQPKEVKYPSKGLRHWRSHMTGAIEVIEEIIGWPAWENIKS